MATGDVTAAVLESGTQAFLMIEGLQSANISGFQPGKSAVLSCESAGYTGTSLGTHSRSGIRTKFRSAEPTGNETLLVDTFTDDDSTALADHTPDTNEPGNPWVDQSGSWAITSNTARTGSTGIATIDLESADVDMSGSVRFITGFTSVGFVLRFQDHDNYVRVAVSHGSQTLHVTQRVAGNDNVIFSATPSTGSMTTNVNYTFRVIISGDTIAVYFRGTQEVDESITQTAHTLHGLYASTNTSIDSLTIETPATDALVTLAAR